MKIMLPHNSSRYSESWYPSLLAILPFFQQLLQKFWFLRKETYWQSIKVSFILILGRQSLKVQPYLLVTLRNRVFRRVTGRNVCRCHSLTSLPKYFVKTDALWWVFNVRLSFINTMGLKREIRHTVIDDKKRRDVGRGNHTLNHYCERSNIRGLTYT